MKDAPALRALTAVVLVGFAWNLALAGSGGAGADEIARGKTLAANGSAEGVPACGGCHGAAGEGQPALGAPRLAGLAGGYLRHQLAAFAAGTRENAMMGPIAKAMQDPAIADVVAYYASLPAPASVTPPPRDPAEVGRGEALALRGDWSANVPACAACHGLHGLGVGTSFPAIAGQSAAYIAEQLRAWKARTRRDDPQGLMGTVAARLDDGQISAVAAYYAGISARGQLPAKETAP